MKRIFEGYIGEQASGKTYKIKKRIKELERKKSIDSIFILDSTSEYFDVGAVIFDDIASYVSYTLRHGIPPICRFLVSPNSEFSEFVFNESIEQGDIVVIIDESWLWAPSGSRWTGSGFLQQIVLAGRHLQNIQQKIRPVHLIWSAQYPKSINQLIWSQSSTIYCAKLSGELSRAWLLGNFGKEKMLRNLTLNQYQFQQLK